MSFRLHHSITLPCTFDEASALVCRSDSFTRLQQISPDCTQCTLHGPSSTSNRPPAPSEGLTPVEAESNPVRIDAVDSLAALQSPTFPEHLPWPPSVRDTSSQDDITGDTGELIKFSFKEGKVARVTGVQVAWQAEGIVLFHSRVRSAGIEEWKLRVLERVNVTNQVQTGMENAEHTRVTETVWGIAPAPLAWFLRVSGMAQRAHTSHMDLYPKLLEPREELPSAGA